jgi:hypothetical protein
MALEIRPDPTPEEREAILRALAELDGDSRQSDWWLAGVRESVGEEDELPGSASELPGQTPSGSVPG